MALEAGVTGALLVCAVALRMPRSSPAQTSANYQNSEHVINSGATPAPVQMGNIG